MAALLLIASLIAYAVPIVVKNATFPAFFTIILAAEFTTFLPTNPINPMIFPLEFYELLFLK